jgi:lipocalin
MTAEPLRNQPVSTLDLNRYAGTWHEIAHLPMYFQRKCQDRITATYTLRADGRIHVRNACRTKAGKEDVAHGIAKPAGGPAGALKVRFAPGWLSWVPWVWADYWVIELDPDYQWAVVGSPSRKYLWARRTCKAARLSRWSTGDGCAFGLSDALLLRASRSDSVQTSLSRYSLCRRPNFIWM